MKINLFALSTILLITVSNAQNRNPQYYPVKQEVMTAGVYYYGEGRSQNYNQANNEALKELLNSIAVNVSSSFEQVIKETDKEVKETVKDVLNTYSTAKLKNVHKITTFEDDELKVFTYIKKSEVYEIFDERKNLIRDIYDQAVNYHKELDLRNALKRYYFSLVLINSIPDQIINHRGENLTTVLPGKISEIIDNTDLKLNKDRQISDSEREITLQISYNNSPVQKLDFSFWDGANYVEACASDGCGIVELLGSGIQQNELNVRIKYNYYENREEIKSVGELWELVIHPAFDNTKTINLSTSEFIPVSITSDQEGVEVYIDGEYAGKTGNFNLSAGKHTVKLRKTGYEELGTSIEVSGNNNSFNFSLNRYAIQPVEEFAIKTDFTSEYKLNIINDPSCNNIRRIGEQTIKLLELIRKKDKAGIRDFLRNDEFLSDKIIKIIDYNDIETIDKAIDADINKTYEGWELRKIRVQNKYHSLSKRSIEYLIFDFDQEGNIYDVNFGITEKLYDEFVRAGNYGDDWERRQVIIKFIEKYRTTFLSRNLSMLENIFADEAVIIVGKILKKNLSTGSDLYDYVKLNENQPDVAYMQYTKNQYIERQKRLFNDKKDLFIDFSTFKITRKNNQEGVYGVSMRQSYYSTGYSDEGYLFLLVDFLQEQPQIYVRSWQPQEWDETSLIRLSNFNIIR